jgi:hypothetical protein
VWQTHRHFDMEQHRYASALNFGLG